MIETNNRPEKTKDVMNRILALNPSYINFKLTSDFSVFFQSLVNGLDIYFELFFTKELEDGVEAVTNIYKNSKIILAYGGTVEDAFLKIINTIISQNKA